MTYRDRWLLPLILIASMPAAAEGLQGYEMVSYLEHRSGSELLAGRYGEAVSSALGALRGGGAAATPLILQTNLCVAYTAQRAFSKALIACDEAVRLAESVDGRRPYSIVAQQAATAYALTNRGVLHALRGDVSSAADDLRKAAALGARSTAPHNNLALLGASPR